MTYFSLFSGIGGFELGMQQAYVDTTHKQEWECGDQKDGSGITRRSESQLPSCAGYSEIDKYAVQIYQRHFPDHKNYGDITTIDAATLPDFDLLCGGFPCQSFSIAGKRGGFDDTRGTLFFEICRLAKAKRPRILFLENVKGLLSHDGGRTFHIIVSALDELGYDCQWQVLNSKDFGVPQNRERVFIIGHLRGTSRPQVFSVSGTDEEGIETRRLYEANGQWLSQSEDGQEEIEHTGNARNDTNRQGSLHERGASAVSKTIRSGGRSSPHGSKQNWDSYEFEGRIRRLTPTECERLQGFNDGWTEGVSDTQRYKTLGNAVTVNVIREIAKCLC